MAKNEAQTPKPMIIAMKGHPGTGKSTLARSLAAALRCPLVDKDDVRDCTVSLQHSLLPPNLLNDLSYQVIFQIASTQLRLGLTVVLDSPLSRPAHLRRLLDLAASTASLLLIVHCAPADHAEWRRRLEQRPANSHKPSTWHDLQALLDTYGGCHDYDVGDVPMLGLDTTAPVEVEELVSAVLRFIESCGGHTCPLDQH